MTKKRYDNHSTEFALWIREQNEIDSNKGYIATDIDFMWKNYHTKQWMLIEEKRHLAEPARWQRQMFALLNKCASFSNYFYGFHLLQFENTNPDDGLIILDRKEITRDDLIEFLQFGKDKSWYTGLFIMK